MSAPPAIIPRLLAIASQARSDLRNCNFVVTGSEVWKLVDEVVIPLLDGRDWKSAIVVARSDQYGVSRQYQVFAERYSTDAIFEDLDAAVSWIQEQSLREAPAQAG